MTLRATVLPIIRHCSALTRATTAAPAADEQIEIECRLRLEAEEFYALFTMLAQSPPTAVTSLGAVRQRDAIYRLPAQRRRESGSWRDYRSRLCYHPTLNELLFAVEKQKMLSAERTIVQLSDAISLRVDASKEIYTDSTHLLDPRHGAELLYWRGKDRRSFMLPDAAHWQIDLTRVVQYRDAERLSDASVQYEVEFELAHWALRTAEPGEMMTQLERVVKFVLGV